MSTPERNARCPCGSGKKYKQCCMRKQMARVQAPKPLHMRQIVAMRSPSEGLLPAQTLREQEASASSVSEGPPEAPTQPSYDSLMQRVFGSACIDTSTQLEEKEKPQSDTLEQADKE